MKALRAAAVGAALARARGRRMGADVKGRHRLRALLDDAHRRQRRSRRRPAAAIASSASAPARHRRAGRETHAARAGSPARCACIPPATASSRATTARTTSSSPPRYRGTALDGDRVAIATWLGYKGTEGRVEEVLERGRAQLTGTLRGSGRAIYLEPDDPRIAATGGHVRLDGAARRRQGRPGGGRRDHALPDARRRAARRRASSTSSAIPTIRAPRSRRSSSAATSRPSSPTTCSQAAERAPQTVRAEDLADRVDLRDRRFMTIDPETARDFDDAVCVEAEPQAAAASRLWVAVADVSHYVRPGSALDREARVRGCSVYLPDRAIPMLPHAAVGGDLLAQPRGRSLRDGRAHGGRPERRRSTTSTSAPRSSARTARLDYPGVAAALGRRFPRRARALPASSCPSSSACAALAKQLRARALERGSLDFDLPEAKVVLDEDDPTRVRDVVQSRGDPAVKGAYQLVEDFMLAANEAVGAPLPRARARHGVARPRRARRTSGSQQFAELAQRVRHRTSTPRTGRVAAQAARLPRDAARASPMERALNFLLLRTLKQAVYDVVNVGHFGLAAPDYLHFTSPIRRYPDLDRAPPAQALAARATGCPRAATPRPPPPRARRCSRWRPSRRRTSGARWRPSARSSTCTARSSCAIASARSSTAPSPP